MTDITIPPEALEAGKDTAFAWLRSHMEDDVRVREMTDEELTELVRAACLAMLRNWPGMRVKAVLLADTVLLPLPQEAKDEKPRRTLDEMRGMFAEAYKHNNRKASDE